CSAVTRAESIIRLRAPTKTRWYIRRKLEKSSWISRLRRAGTIAGPALLTLVLLQSPQEAKAGPLGVIEGQTLDVGADKLDVDIDKGTALLDGHVQATLGDLRVDCARIELGYDHAPNVKWARGTGGVTAKLKGIEATATQ